jgi:hypothetical protein
VCVTVEEDACVWCAWCGGGYSCVWCGVWCVVCVEEDTCLRVRCVACVEEDTCVCGVCGG